MEQGGRSSVFSIATRYELDGPGLESPWGEYFRTLPDMSRGPPSSLRDGYRVSFIVPKAASIHYTLLAPKLSMDRAVPLPPLCAFMACYTVTFTFLGGWMNVVIFIHTLLYPRVTAFCKYFIGTRVEPRTSLDLLEEKVSLFLD